MAPKTKKALTKPTPKPKVEAKKEEAKKDEAEPKVEEEAKAEDVEMVEAVKEEEAAAGEAGAPAAEQEEEKPKEDERPKELEGDAAPDARPKVKAGSVAVNMADTTLNVMPTAGGKLLMTLTEQGLQYLLAGARANVGVKSGRYMFEVKIVEALNPADPQGMTQRPPQPKNLVKVGFSLAGSSLITDGQDSVFFDSEGRFLHQRAKKKVSVKFVRGQTVGVLLNLDAASPNKNTISLFRNGVRVAEPQPLPENLCGKALYPTVTYRNVSVQLNFGPSAGSPLPFQCRMLGDAAAADVEVTKVEEPKGSCEVLMPVGLPEAGFFDWVDIFQETNPGYTELSDRMVLDWAMKSGIWRQKAPPGVAGSNDKPDMRLGIPTLDNYTARKVLLAVSPMLKRNYVVPELRANLVAEERKDLLLKFSAQGFKKKAVVVMGKPPAEYTAKVQELMLADKRARTAAEARRKEQDEMRKRLFEEKKKKAEEARSAKQAAAKKRREREGDEDMDEDEEEEEVKEEEVKEEDEKKEEEETKDAPVELTDEEKGLLFRKLELPDLTDKAMSKSYADFSLPAKDEGFDDVSFAWDGGAACAKVLKDWILEKKLTQRAEDLKPGEWFAAELAKWTKAVSDWRKRCGEWKDPARRKLFLAKRAEEAAAKKKEGKEGEKEEGEEGAAPAAEEAEPMEINHDDLDVFAVEDVMDLGTGEPLFANFLYEDWTLLTTRYELHLMLHAFKKDLNDPDRPSFTEKHVGFYYNKYFKKPFHAATFGVETFAEIVTELVRDTIEINQATGFLETALAEDTPIENFVKLTEEHRRERQRRIDAGDETAKLKFQRPAQQPPRQSPNNNNNNGKGKGKGKGKPRGPSGPDLPRERITAEPVVGEVIEWKGKYGWIQLSIPIEHELAVKHGGKIYASMNDLVGVTELVQGGLVQFHVFSDASGLGAEDILCA